MVTRVNVSPAREPKALEPPAPPNTPVKPPPLPRCSKIMPIKNTEIRINAIIISGGTHVGGTQPKTIKPGLVISISFWNSQEIRRQRRDYYKVNHGKRTRGATNSSLK